jgi:hypothetical protein
MKTAKTHGTFCKLITTIFILLCNLDILRVKTKPAIECLNFILGEAKIAKTLITCETNVHLTVNELASATAKIVDEWRFVRSQIVAIDFDNLGRLVGVSSNDDIVFSRILVLHLS